MESRGRLPEALRRVTERMPQWSASGLPVSICYPDQQAGTLVAGIPRSRPGIAGHYRRLLGEEAGDVPVRFVRCGLGRRHAAKKQRNRPLIGGLWIAARIDAVSYEQGSLCVCAVRGPQSGYVTAGHVAETVGRQMYQPLPHDNNLAGTVAAVSASNDSDSAFVAVPVLADVGRHLIWKTSNSQYTVTGAATPGLGATVYMMGAGLVAEREGTISATDASVTFDDGGVLNDQYLASYRSREGDSGAPVYTKDADPNVSLVGLNVGATAPGDVTTPVDTVAYPPDFGTYAVISKWARIEADLGVTR